MFKKSQANKKKTIEASDDLDFSPTNSEFVEDEWIELEKKDLDEVKQGGHGTKIVNEESRVKKTCEATDG